MEARREDGVHFTPEFSPTVWAYIEAQVRPWLAVPHRSAAAERSTEWGGHRAWR